MEELIKGSFIVSCQALEGEPLHSSFIMSKMALAAKEGGANAIRANGINDIEAIKKEVDLPIIGIVKREYNDSVVYITPTMKEVEELMSVGVDIIALDATIRMRPNNKTLLEFYEEIRSKYPELKLMADCASFEEMKLAHEMGFDFIGTTLFGYTSYSKKNPFSDLKKFEKQIINYKHKVIAEGNITTPSLASGIYDLDVYAIVVGGAITRPKQITETFINELKK